MYVPWPHTGEVIFDALLKCLQSWDLDCRVSTTTLANCRANDNMIGLMEARLDEGSLMLGGQYLHMRCCAHILNLIVQDGLDVIKKSIARIRESIGYWIATPKRYEKFVKTAQQQKVEVKKKLVLDCKTK